MLSTCDTLGTLEMVEDKVLLSSPEVTFRLPISAFFCGISREKKPFEFEGYSMYSDLLSNGDVTIISIYSNDDLSNDEEMWVFDTEALMNALNEISPIHFKLLKCLI